MSGGDVGALEALEWQGLSAGYGGTPVFRDWSARAEPGRLTCLVGPNGAGKSTFLKVLGGVLKPYEGTVTLGGGNLSGLKAGRRARRIALGLTGGLPGGYATVEDTVRMGRHPHTGWGERLGVADRVAIQRAIDVAGVGELRHRLAGGLSDGERQRVLIARTLAQDTPVVLLDEPTAFLDLAHRVELLERLKQLAREDGTIILFSIHDLELAMRYGDRMLLVDRGHNLSAGVPEDLLLGGKLGECFDTRTVRLEMDRCRFAPRRGPVGPPVAVRGIEPAADWARNALEREGWKIVSADASPTDAERIEAGQDGSGWSWTEVRTGTVHGSIEDLLASRNLSRTGSPT